MLSLLAAFGGITAIFQLGFLGDLFGVHAPGPVLSFLPIIATGILFGLAMDYQLFLVSGMREAYAHGAPARVAVQHGLNAGRAVVTAAAIIMISVFAGFVFSHDATIKPIGFGLAFGVLLDAFVVRMLLIPAAMHLLGEHAWWLPRWLDRILPDVDVEGAGLERTHPVHVAQPVRETTRDQVTSAPGTGGVGSCLRRRVLPERVRQYLATRSRAMAPGCSHWRWVTSASRTVQRSIPRVSPSAALTYAVSSRPGPAASSTTRSARRPSTGRTRDHVAQSPAHLLDVDRPVGPQDDGPVTAAPVCDQLWKGVVVK